MKKKMFQQTRLRTNCGKLYCSVVSHSSIEVIEVHINFVSDFSCKIFIRFKCNEIKKIIQVRQEMQYQSKVWGQGSVIYKIFLFSKDTLR